MRLRLWKQGKDEGRGKSEIAIEIRRREKRERRERIYIERREEDWKEENQRVEKTGGKR